MKEFTHYVDKQIESLGDKHVKEIDKLTKMLEEINLPGRDFERVEVSYQDDDNAETYIYDVIASCLFVSVSHLPMLIHYHIKHGYQIAIIPKSDNRIQIKLTKVDHYFKD